MTKRCGASLKKKDGLSLLYGSTSSNNQSEGTTYRVEREILANGEAYRRQKEDRHHLREHRRIELREKRERYSALMAEIKENHKG